MCERETYVGKWHKELELFSKLKSLLILEGNIFDLFTYPENGADMSLPMYLYFYLRENGYDNVVKFDELDGFRSVIDGDTKAMEIFADNCGADGDIHALDVVFAGPEETAANYVKQALAQRKDATAIIMDFASRYITSPSNMSQASVDAFANLLKGVQNASKVKSKTDGQLVQNILIVLVNKLNDIPAWFYLDNPFAKTIHIPTPTKDERTFMVDDIHFPEFFDPETFDRDIVEYEERPEDLRKIKEKFVGVTEGFTKLELRNLMTLCAEEKYHIHQMTEIVDLYRYGIRENPWENPRLQEELRGGENILQNRVKGQPAALSQTLDVIKRAATGLSGLQHSSHTKPKGILFFAGPTGTGKTEMAKSLAELLFGDESRCIRFDMSEYSAEHSDQKLLGAPPGYVGYEAGGQLTNAVRENPFSILLFDEIEKAHGSILDKFLQILEDGRMTDGQGNTVYFSETVIIFTSNLGIYTRNEMGRRELNVSVEEDYATVEKKVRHAIEDYFKLELGRPEILNRIGENIVVFDFIRQDAAREILDKQLGQIVKKLKDENRVDLQIAREVKDFLQDKAFDNLENGGRGVGNVVEKYLLNPLSAFMLDEMLMTDARIEMEGIAMADARVKIVAKGSRL